MRQTIVSPASQNRKCTGTCLRSIEGRARSSSEFSRRFGVRRTNFPSLQSLNLCTAFILYVLSSDSLSSGITPSTVRFMMELVQKSPSSTVTDDEEYKKMKQKISSLVQQSSSHEDIFYNQRFNVRASIVLEDEIDRFSRHVISFWKHSSIFLEIICKNG